MRFRPLAAGEEAAVAGTFDSVPPARIEALLAAQAAGRSTVLVGWLRDKPLGMASLEWMGPRHPQARAAYPACVELHTLEVDASLRSDGIGSRLLAVCEGMAISRGFNCTGLAVAIDNADFYALCLRCGYGEEQRVEYDAPPEADRPSGAGIADAADGSGVGPSRLRFLVKSL